MFDDEAIHIHNPKRAVGTSAHFNGTKPIIRRSEKFTLLFVVWPMRGKPAGVKKVEDPSVFTLVEAAKTTLRVKLPNFVENKVGTWFNRVVVSSQAFTHLCEQLKVRSKADLTEDKERKLRTWLANGMETVVPDFLAKSGEVSGAIYHLEDRFWVIGEA